MWDKFAALSDDGPTVLRPRRGWGFPALGEVWRYRDLLWYLALRDVQVRYKQTALGAAWAVIQPFVSMVVFSVVFGQMMGVASKTDSPYPVFLYAALVPWQFFASTVNASSQSLVGNANMLRKVYFPRLLVPLSAAGAPLVDYAVASTVLIGLMWWYGVAISWQLLLLPLMLASTVLAALGVGILLSAMTVTYRDFRFVVQYMLQIWFFLTPVLLPVTVVPERFQWVVSLNPVAGPILACRSAILGTPIDWAAWLISTGVALLCLLIGLVYFNRADRQFADVV